MYQVVLTIFLHCTSKNSVLQNYTTCCSSIVTYLLLFSLFFFAKVVLFSRFDAVFNQKSYKHIQRKWFNVMPTESGTAEQDRFENYPKHRSEPIRSRVAEIGSRSDPDPGNLVREPDRGSRIADQCITDVLYAVLLRKQM